MRISNNEHGKYAHKGTVILGVQVQKIPRKVYLNPQDKYNVTKPKIEWWKF